MVRVGVHAASLWRRADMSELGGEVAHTCSIESPSREEHGMLDSFLGRETELLLCE